MSNNLIATDELPIESGIPLPEAAPGRKSIYPWHKMKVGDSFLVTLGANQHLKVRAGSLRSAAASAAKKYGHKYTARIINGDTPSIRVWRTA